MLVGLLSGSLTSTPAFSAAKATVTSEELEAIVAVGHGIAYLFGVIGVVLFVQLVPKFESWKLLSDDNRRLLDFGLGFRPLPKVRKHLGHAARVNAQSFP